MAAQFQDARERAGLPTRGRSKAKKNNVWGSILQEESLEREMTGIGVGRRSLRDLDSDRGAETYDYVLAQEVEQERRARREREEREREEEGLDKDLNEYFNSRKSKEGEAEEGEEDDMETGN